MVAAKNALVPDSPISNMLGIGGGDAFVQQVQDQLDAQRKQKALTAAGGGQQKSLISQTLGIV